MTSRSHRLIAAALLAAPSFTAGQAIPRPLADPALGWQIAEQGNRALVQIRAESRLTLEDLALPPQP